MKKMTPQEFLLTLVGRLFAPPIAIILTIVYTMGIQGSHMWAGSSEAEGRAVRERSQPLGVAVVIVPNASQDRTRRRTGLQRGVRFLPRLWRAGFAQISRTLPHGASASGL